VGGGECGHGARWHLTTERGSRSAHRRCTGWRVATRAADHTVYWLIVTDDVRPSMEIPSGDSLDVIRAIVLVDQRGGIALAVERGFSNADPTLPPD